MTLPRARSTGVATALPVLAAMPAPPVMAPASGPTARPGGVTFAGILMLVYGSLASLFGVLLAVGGGFMGAFLESFLPGGFGAALGGVLVVLGILMLAIGVLEILAGLGVLKGKSWARWTSVVLFGLGGLQVLSFDIFGILMGGLSIAGLVMLVNGPAAAWFGAKAAMPT